MISIRWCCIDQLSWHGFSGNIKIGLWLLAVDFSLERRNCAGLELRFDGLCGLESRRVCGLRLGCSMQPFQGATQCGECIGALWR